MRFWDSSALLPLLLQEPASPAMRALAMEDHRVLVWWATEVECAAALARAGRIGHAGDGRQAAAAFRNLAILAAEWNVVGPSQEIKATAVRMLRAHPLRAADALQLAAALVAAAHRPESLEVVSLDRRLAQAARAEGFPVLMPLPS